MNDAEYTEMMLSKKRRAVDTEHNDVLEITSSTGVRSGNVQYGFYVTGTTGWSAPTVYVNSDSLKVSVAQERNVTDLSVTLYRAINSWFDEKLGTKIYKTASFSSGTWSVSSGRYYYAHITRNYSPVGTTGTIKYTW